MKSINNKKSKAILITFALVLFGVWVLFIGVLNIKAASDPPQKPPVSSSSDFENSNNSSVTITPADTSSLAETPTIGSSPAQKTKVDAQSILVIGILSIVIAVVLILFVIYYLKRRRYLELVRDVRRTSKTVSQIKPVIRQEKNIEEPENIEVLPKVDIVEQSQKEPAVEPSSAAESSKINMDESGKNGVFEYSKKYQDDNQAITTNSSAGNEESQEVESSAPKSSESDSQNNSLTPNS